MLEKPVISVIVPVYNKKRYIERTLQTIQQQSFRDFECLLIDDGSTDGSGEICDDFAEQDSRFKVFHIPNGGVSHARNLGLDHARGEYITFIDADDGVQVDYLENLWRCEMESGADLVISGCEKIAADGTVLQRVIPHHQGTVRFDELLPEFAREQLETGVYGFCCAKLFSYRLAQGVRFDKELKLAEDFDFYLKLYETIETVHLDSHAYYQYLQDAENSTGNTASEKIDFLAQLRINLRYRAMLQKREAYRDENRKIVEQRLGSYAFFMLFHTPLDQYRQRFEELYALWKTEQIPLESGRVLNKWLFFCLRNRCCSMAKGTMCLYRFAREFRRVLRCS